MYSQLFLLGIRDCLYAQSPEMLEALRQRRKGLEVLPRAHPNFGPGIKTVVHRQLAAFGHLCKKTH